MVTDKTQNTFNRGLSSSEKGQGALKEMQSTSSGVQVERNPESYLSDKDLANMLGLSPSWCRRQRYLRNKGEPHSLTIEAVYVGSSPRYKGSDVKSWLDTL